MLKLIPKGRKSQWHSVLHVPLADSGQSRGLRDSPANASAGPFARNSVARGVVGRTGTVCSGKPSLGDALAPVFYRAAGKWFPLDASRRAGRAHHGSAGIGKRARRPSGAQSQVCGRRQIRRPTRHRRLSDSSPPP